MKAIKTEELIDELCQVAFRFKEKDNKKLHDLCQVAEVEVKELERLARIGEATEKAFEKTHQAMFVTYWQEEEGGEHYVDTNCSFNFNGVDDLLKWAESNGGYETK